MAFKTQTLNNVPVGMLNEIIDFVSLVYDINSIHYSTAQDNYWSSKIDDAWDYIDLMINYECDTEHDKLWNFIDTKINNHKQTSTKLAQLMRTTND